MIGKVVLLFQSSILAVRRRATGRKVPGHLPTPPSRPRAPLCPSSRTRGSPVFKDLSRGGGGCSLGQNEPKSLDLVARRGWKNGRVSKEDRSCIGVLTHWPWNNTAPDCPLGDGTSRRTLGSSRKRHTDYISNLLSLSPRHHICHCGFPDYSRLWTPESIFPDESVWIFFLGPGFIFFLPVGIPSQIFAGVFGVSQTPERTGAFSRLQTLLAFLSPYHSKRYQTSPNCLSLLPPGRCGPAFPPWCFALCSGRG